ncbi:MAG: hypothetical protein KGL39_08080 [Patescibacteria group bacterium]|nr:hypothetical protein [Patescibacteria group bacterium]
MFGWFRRPKEPPQQIAHRLAPDVNKELERENKVLARQIGQLQKELAASRAREAIAKQEGRDEALESCQWRALDLGYKDLAEEIGRQRRLGK